MEIYNYKKLVDYVDEKHDSDEFQQDELYRMQLLSVFDINDMNKLTEKIEQLYDHICKSDDKELISKLDNILMKKAGKLLSEDKILGMIILFSYNNFHIIHRFLVGYFLNLTNYDILDELNKNE